MDHSRSWDPRNPHPAPLSGWSLWQESVCGERSPKPGPSQVPGPRSQVPADLSLRACSGGFGAQPVTALVRAPPAGWI